MQILVENFGGFKGSQCLELLSKTLPNGKGKTTMINAYIFALTGKTINGFVPINVDKAKGEITSVALSGLFDTLPTIRRTTYGEGTVLYVGDDVATQEDFVSALRGLGYDLDFIIACANANILTSNGLDTATLRKILSKVDVLNSDEYDELKKKQKSLRAKRKVAEQHALTTVVVPAQMCPPLTDSEVAFERMFKGAKLIVNEGVHHECPHCERHYNDKTISQITKNYDEAKLYVKDGVEEFTRICVKMLANTTEMGEIDLATNLLNIAKNARKDVVNYNKEIQRVTEELSDLDARSVKANLPDSVEVITEIKQKNGGVKSTCTLEYKGIPLRSINHAKRIELCVAILDYARNKKSMECVPIIVDNAEAVDNGRLRASYKNLILLSARH